MSEAVAPPPLKLPTKISYGLGTVAFGISGAVLAGDILQLYFNQVLGLPALWVGTAIMLSIVVDAVVDPLIGRWSDQLRSPLGRRHTLMYAAAIPSALGFWLVFNPPQGLSPPMLMAFMVGAILFARIAISFYEIPSTALAPELATTPLERTSLFAWRMFFLIGGAGAFLMVLYSVFLRQDAANPEGVLNPERYAQFGTVAAIGILVAVLISTAATHSRIKYLHRPPPSTPSIRETFREAREVLGNRQLLTVMSAAVLMSLAGGASTGLGAYFNLHYWGLPPEIIGVIVGAASVAAVLALFLAAPAARLFGKVRALTVLYLAWLATAVFPPLLRTLGAFPANGDPLLLPILTVNFTLGVTCLLTATIIAISFIADIVAAEAERKGLRSEGLTFAVYGVADKCAKGGGAFVAGAFLTLVNFPVRAVPGTVDPQIVNNLVFLFMPFATVLNLAAIFLLSRLRESPARAPVLAATGGAL